MEEDALLAVLHGESDDARCTLAGMSPYELVRLAAALDELRELVKGQLVVRALR